MFVAAGNKNSALKSDNKIVISIKMCLEWAFFRKVEIIFDQQNGNR